MYSGGTWEYYHEVGVYWDWLFPSDGLSVAFKQNRGLQLRSKNQCYCDFDGKFLVQIGVTHT